MAIQDPKAYMKPTEKDDHETSTDDLKAQVAELSSQVRAMTKAATKGGGLDAAMLEAMLGRVATMTAEAQDRMLHPDNREHPGISVYSYPEGDLKRPRPDLKCAMTWVGYPLTTDTLRWDEIELLNRAEPGDYTFMRTDRSTDKLVIRADRDVLGQPTRLHFEFLTAERKDTLPAMVDMLRSAFHVLTPEQEEIARLKADLERLRQPVGA